MEPGDAVMTESRAIEVLFSAAEIAHRNDALARQIADQMGSEIQVIAVLKGSFVFAADLIRALHGAGVRPRIDFMTLSSYGAARQSSGDVAIQRDLSDGVAGQDILLVDDILESGRTLAFAKRLLNDRGARSVKLCILLDKPGKRAQPLEADYVGFVCPDRFVVGYGLDYAHYYRELPFIGVVAES